jgi:hypothetical protein
MSKPLAEYLLLNFDGRGFGMSSPTYISLPYMRRDLDVYLLSLVFCSEEDIRRASC